MWGAISVRTHAPDQIPVEVAPHRDNQLDFSLFNCSAIAAAEITKGSCAEKKPTQQHAPKLEWLCVLCIECKRSVSDIETWVSFSFGESASTLTTRDKVQAPEHPPNAAFLFQTEIVKSVWHGPHQNPEQMLVDRLADCFQFEMWDCPHCVDKVAWGASHRSILLPTPRVTPLNPTLFSLKETSTWNLTYEIYDH